MSIEQRSQWDELLQETDAARQVYLGQQLAGQLTEAEIDQIASIFCESSDENARYSAGGLLLYLYRNHSQQFGPAQQSRVQDAAAEMVRSEYPRTRLGGRSFALLYAGDKSRAEQILVSGIDPLRLATHELRLYLSGLERLCTPATIDKLEKLETMAGEIGQLANQSLGNIGRLSRSQLETLASQFKSEKSAAPLYKLFHVFLRFQAHKPLEVVRELMGEPASVGKFDGTDCLIYRANGSYGEVKILFQNGVITTVVSDE